jgi:hypothetical protein
MKKLFSIFAVIALIGMFACTPKQEGPSQEEFDKLSKEIVDKDATIAQLEDEMEMMIADMDLCNAERDSLLTLTTKKGTTKPTTTKPTTTTTQTGTRTDMKGGTTTTTTTGREGMKKN